MEFAENLRDIISDLRYELPVRKEAARLLEQWNAGIVPSPGQLKKLRKLMPQRSTCGRLHRDRTCTWLRKNAKAQGLRPPGPGQKVVCNRLGSGAVVDTFEECPGYRKKMEIPE
jgi:hypothetical protein